MIWGRKYRPFAARLTSASLAGSRRRRRWGGPHGTDWRDQEQGCCLIATARLRSGRLFASASGGACRPDVTDIYYRRRYYSRRYPGACKLSSIQERRLPNGICRKACNGYSHDGSTNASVQMFPGQKATLAGDLTTSVYTPGTDIEDRIRNVR
jgi:hypothetical protein